MFRNLFTAFAFAITLGSTILAMAPSAHAAPVGVTSLGSLGSTDSYSWNQLGVDGTVVSAPQLVTSTGGSQGVVSSIGNYLQVRVQGSDWSGNFTPGTNIIWTNSNGPDITFALVNPVGGIGAQIQENQFGAFTAQISAYDSANSLLGSFTENGNSTSTGDGSAIFIGLLDSTSDISKIVFSLSGGTNLNDFAIGPIAFGNSGAIAPTPLPASLPMFLFALVGLGLFSLRQRRSMML